MTGWLVDGGVTTVGRHCGGDGMVGGNGGARRHQTWQGSQIRHAPLGGAAMRHPHRQQAVAVAKSTAAGRDRGVDDEEASGGGRGTAMEKMILRGCACGETCESFSNSLMRAKMEGLVFMHQ